MRIRVPHEDKTCFDCEHATEKGKMSVKCRLKGISVYASNATYMRCKRERAYAKANNEILFQGHWIKEE